MGKPDPPAQPNPYQVASAQGAADIRTAIAQTMMNNAFENSPYGSVSYNQINTNRIPMPDGTLMDVPVYQRNVTLTPQQQQLLDQQQQEGQNLNQLAIDQTARINNLLSQPMTADGLPARTDTLGPGPTFQSQQTSLAGGGPIQRQLPNSDYGAQRDQVTQAILSRVQPQLDRDRSNLETKLVNQGLVRGSAAFNAAMDEANRQANDAYSQAVLAGGQEQSRLAGLDLQSGQFANAAQDQQFGQNQTQGQFANTAIAANNQNAQQGFQNAQSAGMFGNTARQQALQETQALRNQPINEISTLLNGGQVTVPQFANYQAGTIAQTPLAQSVYNSAGLDQQNYQTRMQNLNATLGALGGVAGAGLYGYMRR